MAGRRVDRRSFCRLAGGVLVGAAAVSRAQARRGPFHLRYILASSLYGRLPLAEVLAQASAAFCEHVDIWPEKHANHREQLESMGRGQFAELLARHGVRLGVLTRYDLGPFALQEEMRLAAQLGASMIVCGSRGPAGLAGRDLRAALADFIEKMKPHVAVAEDQSITIAIENHANSLVASVDSIRRFAEMIPSNHLGLALAPYHLPQDADLLANLIRHTGPRLAHFYAWQYGRGCHEPLPKDQELLQMPGRGLLDFRPLIAALADINYQGWTEIFMHPVPRGIPILPTAAEVTAEINRSRAYLEKCLAASEKGTRIRPREDL
jgi:sugar phosphate isomerase/epimerase